MEKTGNSKNFWGIIIILYVFLSIAVAEMVTSVEVFVSQNPIPVVLFSIFAFAFSIFILRVRQKTIEVEERKKAEIEEQKRIEKERIEKERQEEIAKIERRRKFTIVSLANKFLNRLQNMLVDCLIIDSNIWMEHEYNNFFKTLQIACERYNCTLKLFGPQFDEISNIKRKTDYRDPKGRKARLAINRIEKMQIDNILDIVPITLDAKKGAYADPLIVNFMIRQVKNNIKCYFISEDHELRIRVRQHLKDLNVGDWEIIDIKSLLPSCDTVIESLKYVDHKLPKSKNVIYL